MRDDEAKLAKAAKCRRLANETLDVQAAIALKAYAAELEAEAKNGPPLEEGEPFVPRNAPRADR